MNTKIIAELGNVHEGSVGIAKSLIDMAVYAGVDGVKFQMHIAEFESTKMEPFRVKFSVQDRTRHEYWNRVSFSPDHWHFLRQYCKQVGLEFICTPFSTEAAKFLENDLQVTSFKIGSGDAANWPLLDYCLSTGKTTMISTGLLSMEEIKTLITWISDKKFNNAIVLHCVSQYPVPIEKISMHIMDEINAMYPRVGYSDHSGNVGVAKYALTRDYLEIIEVHLTPHKSFFGPDVTSSLTPEEIREITRFRDLVNLLNTKQSTKSNLYEEALETRKIFRKGLFAARDIICGEILSEELINLRKPVLGIDSVDMYKAIGTKFNNDVKSGEPISWQDLGV